MYLSLKSIVVSMGLVLVAFQTSSAFAGDSERGQKLASSCAACHGTNGNSTSSTFPKLAGQNSKYLIKQLQDYQSGARKNTIMQMQVSAFSNDDIADIAAFYSEQKDSLAKAKPENIDLGQKIYSGGIDKKNVPACTACHGPAGNGLSKAGFPSLSGQHSTYLIEQLKAYRSAGREDDSGLKRDNDGDSKMMRIIASRLSDEEIKAVANYIQGLR